MLYYLFYKRKLEEYQRYQSESSDTEVSRIRTEAIKPTKSKFLSGIGIGSGGKKKKENDSENDFKALHGIDETSIRLLVFDELYVMLIQIDLKPELSSKILIDIAKRFDCSHFTRSKSS